jgi:polar amino acid transport system substrate-binding protein
MTQIRLAWLVLPVLMAAGSSGSGQAATLAEIKARGYMVVAVAAETSPFATVQNGKRTGFDADLLDKLRHAVPFEIREKQVPAAALAASLQHGEVDVVATSLEISPARQQVLDFAPPLAESTLYYLTRHGDPAIKTLGDLGGRQLGIRKGSATFLALTEVEHNLAKTGNKPLGKPTEYASDAESYQALTEKKVDFVINDIDDLAELAKSKPKDFAVGQPVAHKTYVAWAVAKDNGELADLLKGFVQQQRSNGDLAKLQQKWLGWRFADLPDSVAAQDWWTARQDKPAVFPIPSLRDPD